jgi:L-ascorbate metabolism protein UlaG (beta-lactamase superfamily)
VNKKVRKIKVYGSIVLILIFTMLFAACSKDGAASSDVKSSSTTVNKSDVQATTNIDSNEAQQNTVSQVESSTIKKVEAIDSLTIKYVGNACFYIEASNGTRIITDPYESTYDMYFAPFPDIKADLVTVSHYHPDHAGVDRIATSKFNSISPDKLTDATSFDLVNGETYVIYPECLNKVIKIGGVEITGYPSRHHSNEGDNTIFVFKAGNLKIVHMGSTDKIESPEALAAIKDADVLLAYTGEQGEVKNKDIFAFADKMNIKAVLPQHFSMDPNNIFYNSATLDQVIKELPKGTEVVKANELIVKKDMKKEFILLSPMGKK